MGMDQPAIPTILVFTRLQDFGPSSYVFDRYQYQVAQRFPAHRTVHPMAFWSISSWMVRFYFGAMDQRSRRGLRLGMNF